MGSDGHALVTLNANNSPIVLTPSLASWGFNASGTNALSISAICTFTTYTGGNTYAIIALGSGFSTTNYWIGYSSGSSGLAWKTPSATTVLSGAPTVGLRYHLVGTTDIAGNVTFYINGVQVATTTGAGNATTALNFQVGGMPTAGPLSGLIASAYLWNRTLSATEVRELYIDPYGMFLPQPRIRVRRPLITSAPVVTIGAGAVTPAGVVVSAVQVGTAATAGVGIVSAPGVPVALGTEATAGVGAVIATASPIFAGGIPVALVAHLAQASTNTNGFTSNAITTTGATLLVAAISDDDGTTTLSDSKSNIWLTTSAATTGDPAITLYYAVNPTVGASHTFTTTATNKSPAIFVAGFSGITTSGLLDQVSAFTSGFSATEQAGSITPTQNYELVVAATTFADVIYPLTIDSNYTITDQMNQMNAAHHGGALRTMCRLLAAATNPQWFHVGYGNSLTGAAIASFYGRATFGSEVSVGAGIVVPSGTVASAVQAGTALTQGAGIVVASGTAAPAVKERVRDDHGWRGLRHSGGCGYPHCYQWHRGKRGGRRECGYRCRIPGNPKRYRAHAG